MTELRDRNTVKMVAKYWMVSDETVYRLIKLGALACLRLQGTIRITREQVEDYEREYSGKAPQPVQQRRLIRADKDAFQLGREIAGRLMPSSPSKSADKLIPPPPQLDGHRRHTYK